MERDLNRRKESLVEAADDWPAKQAMMKCFLKSALDVWKGPIKERCLEVIDDACNEFKEPLIQ